MDISSSQAHAPETAQSLDGAERVRLMMDGIVNNLTPLASGAVGIVLVPIMFRGLGAEAYGLWIIALSLPGLVGAVDFGLGISVALQVSACRNGDSRRQAAGFVMAAGNAHVAMGLVSAVLIGAFGLFAGDSLHPKSSDMRMIPAVIGLVGVSHICERISGIEGEVLFGLRRFDVTNLISVAASALEFVGIVGLLAASKGLVYVAAWHTLVAAAAAYTSYATVARLEPLFRLRLGRIEWRALRPSIRFGLFSQFAEAARSFLWQAPPLIIGLILGSSSVVPYHIGRRIPQMINDLYMRASAVLFPAVSEHVHTENRAHIREILEVGTRWIVVWAIPVCLILWTIAPNLVAAWIRDAPPGTIPVLRLITVAVFAEAVAATSIQVLWALGASRIIFIVPFSVLVTSLGLTLVLLPRIGILGAAWGLLAPMTVGAIVFMHLAARACRIRLRDLLRTAVGGLWFPVGVCLALSLTIRYFSAPGWLGVIATALGGGLGYLLGFCFGGAREEEMLLVRQVLAVPLVAGRFVYRMLWRLLRRVGFIRSGYYLVLAIKEALLDSPARGRAELDHEFEPRADPWDYAKIPQQRERICTELAMLDAVRGEAPFERALEIGCAEGLFTQPLAERCKFLLAVDISSVALARARQRCQGDERVHFAEWDLRIDPLPDTYDLIVIIHALEYVRNPLYIRRARAKLVAGLHPGGYLLMGTMKVGEVLENAWWGRYFLRSGQRINTFFAEHPALKVVKTAEFHLGKNDISYDVLFRKTR